MSEIIGWVLVICWGICWGIYCGATEKSAAMALLTGGIGGACIMTFMLHVSAT